MAGTNNSYVDPNLNPDFVRSTKDYLKQKNQKDVRDRLKREEMEALSKTMQSDNISQPGMSSGLSYLHSTLRSPSKGAGLMANSG